MIFVTVGTTDFDALIRAMDSLAPSLDEPVVMQIGVGKVRPGHASEWFRFASSLEQYYQSANLVVSHGGLGTVVEVMRGGGRLVAVSNTERYDQHQDDLLAWLERAGNLIWCRDLSALGGALAAARIAEFCPYEAPPCSLHQEIAALLTLDIPQSRLRRFCPYFMAGAFLKGRK